jgi:hypothetical protein
MEADMRLIHRHRRRPPRRVVKIPITQAEITADLIYPARPKK